MVFAVIADFMPFGKNCFYIIGIFGNPAAGKEESGGDALSFKDGKERGGVFVTPR